MGLQRQLESQLAIGSLDNEVGLENEAGLENKVGLGSKVQVYYRERYGSMKIG